MARSLEVATTGWPKRPKLQIYTIKQINWQKLYPTNVCQKTALADNTNHSKEVNNLNNQVIHPPYDKI